MKIILCGYMGSGKSTVGKLLASELDMEFQETDYLIEKEFGMPIQEIFQKKGEIQFRKKESFVLHKLLNQHQDLVISLGGGTPCYGNNLEIIKQTPETKLIYLHLSLDKLVKRLTNEKSSRPLISHLKTEEDLKDFVRKHLFERQFYYNQADYKVATDKLSKFETMKEVNKLVG